MDYAPHFGVLVPVDGRATTHLEFKDVSLGETIVGYTGIHDYYSRKSGDGPVDISLFVDGLPFFDRRVHNEDGWKRFVVDTSHLGGGRHTVRFDIESPSPAWRTFGFFAESLKKKPDFSP